MKQVNWLDLPEHVLPLISQKLIYIKDYIRFGAVCHTWYSIYTNNRCILPSQLPLLMLPINCDNQYRGLYDPSEKRVYDFQLPVPHNYYCRGSSEGWLVTVYEKHVVRLLNPFLSVDNEIELPPLTAFELHEDDMIVNEAYLYKAVLSASPTSDPDNYVVISIYGGCCKLAFYKPGDDCWTSLDSECTWIDDIVYCRDQFYAVDHYGAVWACDVRGSHPRVSRVASPIDDMSFWMKKYIVESSGDLLQVKRILVEDDENYETIEFEVFKLDEVELKWDEVKSLCGKMLFLGENSSISLLASNYPGCKPNCIYFTDDYHAGYCYRQTNEPHDMGVYNLEDGTIEPHCPLESKRIFPAPIWIQATPQGCSN